MVKGAGEKLINKVTGKLLMKVRFFIPDSKHIKS